MSNWIFEDAINWVFDRLVEAKVPAGKLSYVRTILLGQHPELDYASKTAPGLIVRLHDPERDGRWSMSADKTRDEDLSIVIEMWIHPESKKRPYGHRPTNKRGYSTLVSDVGNTLESHPEWPAFGPVGLDPAFDATYQGLGHLVENTLYVGRALVIPTLRFTAGQR